MEEEPIQLPSFPSIRYLTHIKIREGGCVSERRDNSEEVPREKTRLIPIPFLFVSPLHPLDINPLPMMGRQKKGHTKRKEMSEECPKWKGKWAFIHYPFIPSPVRDLPSIATIVSLMTRTGEERDGIGKGLTARFLAFPFIIPFFLTSNPISLHSFVGVRERRITWKERERKVSEIRIKRLVFPREENETRNPQSISYPPFNLREWPSMDKNQNEEENNSFLRSLSSICIAFL